MFNSLKKWVNKNEEEVAKPAPPAGMQTMRSELQRKFAKGIQYNSKFYILILDNISSYISKVFT